MTKFVVDVLTFPNNERKLVSVACFLQTASKITSDTISMIAEAYCFAAIGLSVHEFDASQWCWGFIVAMILVLMTAR